mgnify:FL=1
MVTRISTLVLLSMAVMVAGCGRGKTEVKLAVGPDAETLAVPDEFGAEAIEAAGGMDAWAGTKQFDLDCIASFYQPDGSYYLTEQHYTIYPWSRAAQIRGHEPGGSYLWQLAMGRFSVKQGARDMERLTESIAAEDLAQALLAVTATPALLLDDRVSFETFGEPVKLEGRWYVKVRRTVRVDALKSYNPPEIVFYHNRRSGLLDRIWMVRTQGAGFLLVQCHDYQDLGKDSVHVPKRIEIFDTDEQGATLGRLIKIDLK